MELLGLPTNAQVCTMLTHESCGVPPLSSLGLRKEPIRDYCTRNQVRVTSVCEIVCTLSIICICIYLCDPLVP